MDEKQAEESMIFATNNEPTIEIIEETPLIYHPSNEEEFVEDGAVEAYEWTTNLITESCRDGNLKVIRALVEFSKQMTSLAEYASGLTDKIDSTNGLSPLHLAARNQHLHICLLLLSNLEFVYGVNIKDANDRTPIHLALHSPMKMSNVEVDFRIEKDFGEILQPCKLWQEEYESIILTSDHPLIYLFAKANGNLNAQDKYLLTPLHYAVVRNNIAGVQQLIKLKADIESQDRQGVRPFHLACRENHLSIVDYLMDHNVKLDAKDSDNWTGVHFACLKGHLDVVKLINSKNAAVFQGILQMRTNTQATCLHLAIQSLNTQLVEYMLIEYKKINLQSIINDKIEPLGTPLHIAATFTGPSMIRLLFDYHADPYIVNSYGQTSLHSANLANNLANVEELNKLTNRLLLEIKDDYGRTTLSVTTDPSIADYLIRSGADMSSIDKNDMNAIMLATVKGRISVVRNLLSALDESTGKSLDQRDKKYGRTVFLLAVEMGSIDMCSLLLSNSYVDWNTIDRHNMNAFHIAAENNHYELIKYLCNSIESGDIFVRIHRDQLSPTKLINSCQRSSILNVYIDAKNDAGKTPLHLASEKGHLSSIQMLIQHNANVLIKNDFGQLPFHEAVQNGHSQCVELLIKVSMRYSADFELILSRRQSPLVTACQNGCVNTVKILLAHNIGIHGSTDDHVQEKNPLEIAIKYRRREVVNILLEHPHSEYWLSLVQSDHQTPLREMIRHMPDCAKHAFDKSMKKTYSIVDNGNIVETIDYSYKNIDDYFLSDNRLYSTKARILYRNHPLIVALDNQHNVLLEHPLAKRLMLRKWKMYRSFFYLSRILSILLLILSTFYGLIRRAPILDLPTSNNLEFTRTKIYFTTEIAIFILSSINILKIILEILLYRGLRVPYAEVIGFLSYISAFIAFLPFKNQSEDIIYLKWQLISFSILFQWLNIAVIFRSIPYVGQFFILIESLSMKVTSLLIITLPLLISFTTSIHMVFFNQRSFLTIPKTFHKSTLMIVGELDFENLVFPESLSAVAGFLFVSFLSIMTIVFMNFLVGLTVGDIQVSAENASTKANAYWIRELIYIESNLLTQSWLKSNVIERDIEERSLCYSFKKTNIEQDDEDTVGQSIDDRTNALQLWKLLDTLDIQCTQAKQLLEYEIRLKQLLEQLVMKKIKTNSDQSVGSEQIIF